MQLIDPDPITSKNYLFKMLKYSRKFQILKLMRFIYTTKSPTKTNVINEANYTNSLMIGFFTTSSKDQEFSKYPIEGLPKGFSGRISPSVLTKYLLKEIMHSVFVFIFEVSLFGRSNDLCSREGRSDDSNETQSYKRGNIVIK